jgi:outer membrane protein assembly factor BamB
MKIITKLTLFCSIIGFSNQVFCQKVYQWRGENRDGIYNESNLLKAWPESGPKLLWVNETIGAGFAAPVVSNDKVLVNGEINSTSYLFAFDLKGKLLWKSPNGAEYTGSGYGSNFPGARSTPTIAGDLVYSISGKGRIACFDYSTGKEKWAIDMVKDLGGLDEEFGIAESPLIDGDFLYCFPGGAKTNFAALNRFTGKTIWTSKALGDTTSFTSSLLVNLPSRKIIVTMSRHYLLGIDTKNGDLLWSHKIENYKYDGDHANTPVYADGFLYYTTAEENGNGLVKLRLSPDGKKIEELWRNKNAKNAFGGFVKLGNHIFMATDKKNLICVETEKGQDVTSLRPNSGSLIYADNCFYCYNDNGDMKLIKFENGKFTEVGKFKVSKGSKEHFSHTVISNGVFYIRHGNALMAYAIR